MKSFILFAIIALALCSIVLAEDYVKPVGNTPIAKDLSNLNLSEIRAIFAGDPTYMLTGGPSMYTPSQDAFMKDNVEDGKPMGPPTSRAAFVGGVNPYLPFN